MMEDFTTKSQSAEEQASQKLAFPNFLLHIGVENRGDLKLWNAIHYWPQMQHTPS